jgi:hypothetical protein
MTILTINRKPNAERKGPRNPIANFAVAGSISARINPVMKLVEVCKVSGMLSLRLFKFTSKSSRHFCVAAAFNIENVAPAEAPTSV